MEFTSHNFWFDLRCTFYTDRVPDGGSSMSVTLKENERNWWSLLFCRKSRKYLYPELECGPQYFCKIVSDSQNKVSSKLTV